MRLHVLANPSGITSTEFRMDAFNVAVLKFTKHMQKFGHEIIHYGHELSQVDCEHVTLITKDEYPVPDNIGLVGIHDEKVSSLYAEKLRTALDKRVSSGDMILSFYGYVHDLPTRHLREKAYVVEPSIGYGVTTVFSDYRAFVSRAWMHYFYGVRDLLMNPSWFDEVIPNAMTPDEFIFDENKDDYFVYLGRMVSSKGVDLAVQITERLGKRLLIGSSGKLSELGYKSTPAHVEELGYLGWEQRAKVLSKAKALIAPTYYIEPFGNIVAEAAMCGTPVIVSDWGGFTENVNHGVTGYRCRDFKTFLEAAININKIKPADCRKWAIDNFSDDVVHPQFDTWLRKVHRRDFYHVGEY